MAALGAPLLLRARPAMQARTPQQDRLTAVHVPLDLSQRPGNPHHAVLAPLVGLHTSLALLNASNVLLVVPSLVLPPAGAVAKALQAHLATSLRVS